MDLFPVIIYNEGTVLPENEDIYYVVSGNGNYIFKNLETVRSMTKVEGISFLKNIKPFAELKIPIIPSKIIAQAIGFLKLVYNIYRSEGGLLIHYYPATEKYELYCPNQKVNEGNVRWDNKEEIIPTGSLRTVSIHSHIGPAFHSTTDIDSEKFFDGLHITIGNIDRDPTIAASIVINGNRFKLDDDAIKKHLEINVFHKEKITIYKNHGVKKVITKNNWLDHEYRFSLNGVAEDDYMYPYEWRNKFVYEPPERYVWDYKARRFVRRKGKYLKFRKPGKKGPKFYKPKDDYIVPEFPLMCNPHYNGEDHSELPKIDKSGPIQQICNGCVYVPTAMHVINRSTGDCDTCLYKEIKEIYDEDYPIGMDDNSPMRADIDGKLIGTSLSDFMDEENQHHDTLTDYDKNSDHK